MFLTCLIIEFLQDTDLRRMSSQIQCSGHVALDVLCSEVPTIIVACKHDSHTEYYCCIQLHIPPYPHLYRRFLQTHEKMLIECAVYHMQND